MMPRALCLALVLLAGPAVAGSAGEAPHAAHHGPTAGGGDCFLHRGGAGAATEPTEPGQAAFGALAEIVRLLEADATTDWERVSVARLREHLRDMDEVLLRAEVVERPIDGGVLAEITGSGRTLEAIRRMVPAHAAMLRAERPWTLRLDELSAGIALRATAEDAQEAAKLRGLGFFGILAVGDHHQPHHLAMARGSH
jgi:hypothetical protein